MEAELELATVECPHCGYLNMFPGFPKWRSTPAGNVENWFGSGRVPILTGSLGRRTTTELSFSIARQRLLIFGKQADLKLSDITP
jgi:hypothetical protein